MAWQKAFKLNSSLQFAWSSTSMNFNRQSRSHNQQQRRVCVCVCVCVWLNPQTNYEPANWSPRILHFPQDGVLVCVTEPKVFTFCLIWTPPSSRSSEQWLWKSLHYSFMPQRKCAVIVKVRLRGGQMDPLLLIQHSDRPVWLWPKSTPEVIPMTQRRVLKRVQRAQP